MQLRLKRLSPHTQEALVTAPKLSRTSQLNYVIWALIGLGIFFRLFHFFDNRSMFINGIYLSSSLVRMNFLELATLPLDYEQKAPIGYLWMVKLTVLLFGKSEMVLRIFPLLCGIAAVFVFLPVCRYFLKPVGVVIAMGIMTLAPPLIYHTVEEKQYITELLATILVLYLYIRYHKKSTISDLVMWGFWGAVIVWFSYSSIFILAGMAFAIGLSYIFNKNWPALFRSMIPFGMWLISFAVNFFFFTYKHADSEWLVTWFIMRGSFMPLPPASLSELKWFSKTIRELLGWPLGLLIYYDLPGTPRLLSLTKQLLPLLCSALGLLMFFRQDKKVFMMLLFPILLTLLASGLKQYPFFERLIVFLVPLFILFIARGGDKIASILPAVGRVRYIVPLLLLAWPLWSSAKEVFNPDLFGGRYKSYHREAFNYINDHFQKGDVVYVYWNTKPIYRFYKEIYGFKFDPIEGRDVRYASHNFDEYFQNLQPDLAALAGKKRVWFIYNKSYFHKIGEFDGQPAWYYAEQQRSGKLFHDKVASMGKVIQTYEKPHINFSLLDLSNAK